MHRLKHDLLQLPHPYVHIPLLRTLVHINLLYKLYLLTLGTEHSRDLLRLVEVDTLDGLEALVEMVLDFEGIFGR
jgi:hypothetical protein